MSTSLKQSVGISLLLVCSALALCAQERSSAAKGINTLDAPVPTPLLVGKKAFISYELGDVSAFPSSYSGGPERAYSEFYAGMKAWGRFDLVLDPKDADVIFSIRFVDSPGLSIPQIRVGISDAKTQETSRCYILSYGSTARLRHPGADYAGRRQSSKHDEHGQNSALRPGPLESF